MKKMTRFEIQAELQYELEEIEYKLKKLLIYENPSISGFVAGDRAIAQMSKLMKLIGLLLESDSSKAAHVSQAMSKLSEILEGNKNLIALIESEMK
jgi:hypothetical protein